MKGKAQFKIANWNETVFSEIAQGGKLARASVVKTYSGDMQGEGILEYLMTYHADGNAEFYGVERVSGRIGEHNGSFVLQHRGEFSNGNMSQHSLIVTGSGTGELAGLQGESTLSAGHQQEYPFEFEYEIV